MVARSILPGHWLTVVPVVWRAVLRMQREFAPRARVASRRVTLVLRIVMALPPTGVKPTSIQVLPTVVRVVRCVRFPMQRRCVGRVCVR
jgi:hypothetical protein